MNWIKKLFEKKELVTEVVHEVESEVESEVEKITEKPDDGWRLVSEDRGYIDKVVIIACDSYDCGWVMDTAWWYEKKKKWVGTSDGKLHLTYTHWRELPNEPITVRDY